jgi:hypothetical protein
MFKAERARAVRLLPRSQWRAADALVSPADADVAVAQPVGADAEGAEEEAAQQESADPAAPPAAAGDAAELDDSGAHETVHGFRTAPASLQPCLTNM